MLTAIVVSVSVTGSRWPHAADPPARYGTLEETKSWKMDR